ncbi:hypothetical protein KSP40_PGU019909 [Platanthera guangdongensis]|uniref:Uncharacterized protein n=1 Tax=Platanthera guangdongensis TaxID=2320717 RepID=A0ABR2MH58_9ASPA
MQKSTIGCETRSFRCFKLKRSNFNSSAFDIPQPAFQLFGGSLDHIIRWSLSEVKASGMILAYEGDNFGKPDYLSQGTSHRAYPVVFHARYYIEGESNIYGLVPNWSEKERAQE